MRSLVVHHLRMTVALTLAGVTAWCAALRAAAPDFRFEIRPILAKNCFPCHGPDEAQRQAELRLDVRQAALDHGALVPGAPDASEMLRRISIQDADERMPPEETGRQLSAAEIETIRQWIADGAEYAPHWSYAPPQRPALPTVARADWCRNDVDRFVLARLEQAGLQPEPKADRYRLIRRLTFDLTGLPPTLEEVEQFVRDERPDAYAHLVDRLLASPAYGEHWARKWLDLARYADTNGYEADKRRTVWPYRDWVIHALNADMPFDEFTIEQLAGDLLPNATPDQIVATAFHRNTMQNDEGGTDDEEYRVAAIIDRVNTTMQVWMGTTMGCCQCHSHKFDPFTQREYYQLFAFFNQTADADRDDQKPLLSTISATQKQLKADLERQRDDAKREYEELAAALANSQREWEDAVARDVPWRPLKPTQVTSQGGATCAIQDDGSVLVSGNRPNVDTYTIQARPDAGMITALRIEVLSDTSPPGGETGGADDRDFVLSRVQVFQDSLGHAENIARAGADSEREGFPAQHVIENSDVKRRGWSPDPRAAGTPSLSLGFERPIHVVSSSPLKIVLDQQATLDDRPGQTLKHFRLMVTSNPLAATTTTVPPRIRETARTPAEKRTPADKNEITNHYRSIVPELKKLVALQEELEHRLKEELRPVEVPVMKELPPDEQRATHLFVRGSFLNPGEVVAADTPAAFPQLPTDLPKNRLGLARWLVDPINPLTARVVANRHWEQLFGTGIVLTSEDFGSQGMLPSHPELLDWLAVELRDNRWSLKHLTKTIVMSAAYRQSSRVTPEKLERDPDNRLISRGPRVRLSAEQIRDQALAVSGLLSRKIGGPSVMPPQPDGVWQVVYNDDRWITSKGEDRYRRGLYTFWRRTSPYPSAMALDATSRETCTIRRVTTNTPIAAFALLNDPVFIEAAQALARRVMESIDAEPVARATYAFRSVLGRPPKPEETERLVNLHDTELEHFKEDAKAAAAMTTSELGPASSKDDVAELAAWTVVGNVLFNLDESLNN